MKLRPVQLVCLALLLATLRLADPAALAPDSFALRAGVLNVLLRSELTETRAETKALATRGVIALKVKRAPLALPSAEIAALQVVWTMPAPTQQSVDLQSYTSILRA